jgi:electron transfer flavoprotein beta subunit
VTEGKCTVTREVDGGLEDIECQLPVVITADLRLNEPRYATLPNIMKAKSKPLQTVSIDDLGLKESIAAIQGRLRYLSISEPPKRKAGVKVGTVDELIDCLRNEVGVL